MKEKILDAFKNLGFEMEDLEELGYGFEYEGIHYLWMAHNDEDFLNIAVPAIFDKADTNEQEFYQVMDKLNSTLKFIKVNELGNSMWMFYERELFGGEDFEQLLPRIILHLEHALHFMRDMCSGNTEESEEVTTELLDETGENVNTEE